MTTTSIKPCRWAKSCKELVASREGNLKQKLAHSDSLEEVFVDCPKWSWPSWTWVQVSGPVRSGLAPDFVGPGPGGEWTGPWGRTGVGPGLNLYFQFIILCTVSNIILSFCNHFQEGRTWQSLKLFMHHHNESTTPVAGLSSLSLPCTTHFHKFLFHLFLCN